jgi:predicted ATPase
MASGVNDRKGVGRSSDINQIIKLLNEHRLVTILGNIGIGKASVAKSVALRL